MKSITIITQCFNEEDNVREVYERVRSVMCEVGRYRYEHLFIDDASRERTVAILMEIAAADTNVKIIVNARNFGQVRSPMHALCQASGDAVLGIVADLQGPPEMIPDLIREWEKGAPILLGSRNRAARTPSCSGFASGFTAW
jgi:glycosyltransferase involved in cell wall biosynthesis